MGRWQNKYTRAAWALTLATLVGTAYLFGLFDAPELKFLDTRFLLRGKQDPRSPIVIVSIDEDSFDEVHVQWPWPRSLHASVVDAISEGEPRAIGLNILFVEPGRMGPESDQALADAVGRPGNVVLAAFFSEVESSLYLKEHLIPPLPVIREQASGFGFTNLPLDFDGIIRRGTLAREHQGIPRPSFAYRLFELVSGVENKDPPQGTILINFRGPAGTFPAIPYYQVLQGEVPPETFRDKIVLVGATAPSLHDLFSTPFATEQRMAGVEIQANLLETLLQGNPLTHPPRLFHLILVIASTLAAAFIGFRFRPLKAFIVVACVTLVYGAFALSAFMLWSLWLEVAPMAAALGTGYGAVVLRNYIQEEREKRRLSRYFSPAILDEIVRYPDRLSLTSSRRRVTVLFSDIRGFASISERLPPEEVVGLLQDYLTAMTEIIFKHGGTVDKFIGDSIMALYGVPLEVEDHAARAVKTALEMHKRTEVLTSHWVARSGGPLRIGVGINTGEAVVGTMGSAQRLEFTAIGDTVNLASRLEGLARDFDVAIVISQETQGEIGGLFPVEALGELKVRGRETPVKVYAVESVVRRMEFRVPMEIPISLSLDEEFAIFASMINLSKGGAAIRTPSPLPDKKEVPIRFRLPDIPVAFVIKGKVAWSRGEEAGIEFLDLTSEEVEILEKVVERRGSGPLHERESV